MEINTYPPVFNNIPPWYSIVAPVFECMHTLKAPYHTPYRGGGVSLTCFIIS